MTVKVTLIKIHRSGIYLWVDKKVDSVWHMVPGATFEGRFCMRFPTQYSVEPVLQALNHAPKVRDEVTINDGEYLLWVHKMIKKKMNGANTKARPNKAIDFPSELRSVSTRAVLFR